MNFKIQDNSKKCKQQMSEAIGKGLREVSEVVKSQAKANAPVDTGALRQSIDSKTDSSKREAYVGTSIEYGAAVEFGTSRRAEQPYLRSAFRSTQSQAEAIIVELLKSIK